MLAVKKIVDLTTLYMKWMSKKNVRKRDRWIRQTIWFYDLKEFSTGYEKLKFT